jgi:phospholipid/cholesterol/gamma-HCH transport system ATP-binding protein
MTNAEAPTHGAAQGGANREAVLRVRDLKVGFGDKLVMDGLDLDVYRGEVLGFVGASGAGKSVLTRTILGLIPKRAGTIEVYGQDIDAMTHAERDLIEQRWSSRTCRRQCANIWAYPGAFATSWRC